MAKSNKATISETRGPLVDVSNISKLDETQLKALFARSIQAEERSDLARWALRYGMFLYAQTHTDTLLEWDRRFTALKSDAKGEDAGKAKRDARDYFAMQAGIGPEVAAMDQTAKRKRNDTINRFVEDVTVVIAAHRAKAMDAIELENGVIMVDRAKAYGKTLWANIGGDEKEALKKLTTKTKPYIVVHAKSNQVQAGDCDWTQFNNHLQVHAKMRKPGSAGTRRTTADVGKNPLGVLSSVAAAIKADADSARTEGKLISTNSEIAKAILGAEAILKNVCRGPLFSPGWEHVSKGIAMWLKLMNAPTADVITPDNVVTLPAATPKTVANKDTKRNKG